MRDFYNGSETPNTLHNLCEALKRRRDSYLAQAMGLDEELALATADLPKTKGNPDLVEFGLLESLATTQVELLQQIRDFTAGKKKSKVKPLPRPITAKQRVSRALAKRAYEKVMSILRFEDGGE